MRIKVLSTGKTEEKYLKEGIAIYCKKLIHYFPFEYEELPAIRQTKNLSVHEQKKQEGAFILKKTAPTDVLILLDENGRQYSSVDFSRFIQQKIVQNSNSLVFVTGGPYGFSQEVYNRNDHLLSLSLMTFSHQMVRLLFLEQLYRAASILKNEPYHHI
jgi:23S rRNA (pseudouridine1915-N3)-methyltransferase